MSDDSRDGGPGADHHGASQDRDPAAESGDGRPTSGQARGETLTTGNEGGGALTTGDDGEGGNTVGDEVRERLATGDETGVEYDPESGGRVQFLLEYVTFGYGVHHLVKVVFVQFVMLFLDVRLLGYVHLAVLPHEGVFGTAMWLAAAVAFLAILIVLVRQMGRRTLAPRFHRPVHLLGSVCGYLVASGLSFGFGYLTLVVPTSAAASSTNQIPATLVVLVFAAFIAIGYHGQVDAADHPRSEDIVETVNRWLDALSWPDEKQQSLDRERAYEEFLERTDEVETLLANARTSEGERLAADFGAWREQFAEHAALSQERVVDGTDESGAPESERLAAEHEAFRSLRRRLEAVAEATDERAGSGYRKR